MGKKQGTQTIDQSPWGPVQPGLLEAYGLAGEQLANYQPYDLTSPAAAEYAKLISGEYLTNNPYLDDVIRRSMRDVNSQFEGGSRYGSGAHMDALFSSAAAPLRYQDYSRERSNQIQAVTNAPAFQGAVAMAPYSGINAYLDTVLPIARGGQQQTSPIYSNPLAGAAGGALAGAALAPAGASFMGSAATATTAAVPALWPWLLGGALLGGLAS